jgi:hypothetical protein
MAVNLWSNYNPKNYLGLTKTLQICHNSYNHILQTSKNKTFHQTKYFLTKNNPRKHHFQSKNNISHLLQQPIVIINCQQTRFGCQFSSFSKKSNGNCLAWREQVAIRQIASAIRSLPGGSVIVLEERRRKEVISEFWVVKNMIGCSRATTILEF